ILAFFPRALSLALLVRVQRALDVRLLLRMGTKYALARYTLLVAEFAVVAFVIFHFVFPLVRHKENLPVAIPVLALLAAGLIKLFASHDSISNRLQPHLGGPARLLDCRISAPRPQLWHRALHRRQRRRAHALRGEFLHRPQ